MPGFTSTFVCLFYLLWNKRTSSSIDAQEKNIWRSVTEVLGAWPNFPSDQWEFTVKLCKQLFHAAFNATFLYCPRKDAAVFPQPDRSRIRWGGLGFSSSAFGAFFFFFPACCSVCQCVWACTRLYCSSKNQLSRTETRPDVWLEFVCGGEHSSEHGVRFFSRHTGGGGGCVAAPADVSTLEANFPVMWHHGACFVFGVSAALKQRKVQYRWSVLGCGGPFCSVL